MELTAAVLAAKLSASIVRELEFEFSRIVFWSDATVVLRYINNTSTRFRTFVANRIELIHTLTSADQWRYVPTDLNPADIALRGVLPDMVDHAGIWFSGPQFLYDCASGWPNQPDFLRELHDDDPEIKPARASMAQIPLETKDCLNRLFERYPDLRSLLLSVCWMLRFKQYLKWNCTQNTAKPQASSITVEEIENAQMEVIKILQRQAFSDAFKFLHDHVSLDSPRVQFSNEQLSKTPALRELKSLNPLLCSGILRVGGRLQNSALPLDSKHPMILQYRHSVTDLMIKDCHEREGHMGASQVLTAMNKDYWIIKGRSAVKRVIQTCLSCRFWKAVPGQQHMGNLPADRVNESKPFTSTGTDLMGPIQIKCGRNLL